jgi:serine-type D-Ala-D-Ala carboxypeptidase/endopeptidase (penicillin-binding protein 4)
VTPEPRFYSKRQRRQLRSGASRVLRTRRIKRKNTLKRAGLILILILAASVSVELRAFGQSPARAAVNDALVRRIDAVLATTGFQNGHWGVLVVDRKSGQVVYERNADQLFAPASVTKLFSTSAALIELGPGYRFQTPLVRHGEVDAKGKLQGELILIAQGDLCMGGRTGTEGTLLFKDEDHTYSAGNLKSEIVATNPLAGLDHLAREVQAAGIHEITGDVIVDDRLFLPASATGSGPSRVSPIVINDNVIDVLARPAANAGEPASVTFQPATQFVTIDAMVETVDAGKPATLAVERAGPQKFAVRGQLPVSHAQVVKIAEIEQPASFARALLIEALRRRGVRVAASPLGTNNTGALPARGEVTKLPKVAEYTSPPFSENVRVILKVSHNLHASTLPLLIAAHHGERTLEEGLKRQGEILKSLGLEAGTVSFGGGAGGSRSDLATPRAAVTLLRAMSARPEFPAYEAALPVLGRDGTLAKAVAADSPARGHARAKTGTYYVGNDLDGTTMLTSKALAGYLETASGRSLVFAAFVNNVPLDAPKPNRTISDATAQAGRVLGKLCEALYTDSADTPGQARRAEPTAGASRPAG